MVIGKKYLSPRVTADLIRLTQVYGVTEHLDQDIINHYFDGQVHELPLAYNFLKIYHKPIFRRDGLAKYVKILHYVVKKPWQQKSAVNLEEGTLWLERYWYDVYAKTLRLRHDSVAPAAAAQAPASVLIPVPVPVPVPAVAAPSTLPPLRTRDELGSWMTQMGYTLAAEVGVQRGNFSRQLLSTWPGELLMIDAWERLPDYQDVSNVYNDEHAQLMAVAQQVAQAFAPRGVIVKAKSPECAVSYADGSLDLVYLDANHSYEAVLADIQAWLPKLRPGGALAGHDYVDGELPQGRFGVKRAVNEFFGRAPDLVTEETWATWLYLVK
jgi:SAM-dependent methyltransferase